MSCVVVQRVVLPYGLMVQTFLAPKLVRQLPFGIAQPVVRSVEWYECQVAPVWIELGAWLLPPG